MGVPVVVVEPEAALVAIFVLGDTVVVVEAGLVEIRQAYLYSSFQQFKVLHIRQKPLILYIYKKQNPK